MKQNSYKLKNGLSQAEVALVETARKALLAGNLEIGLQLSMQRRENSMPSLGRIFFPCLSRATQPGCPCVANRPIRLQ